MFREILKDAVDGLPGAIGAIFADWEGESVEFYYAGPEDDIKLMGAHQGILLGMMREAAAVHGHGPIRCMLVAADVAKILVMPLKDGYYIAMMLEPYANGGLAIRAAEAAAVRLKEEM